MNTDAKVRPPHTREPSALLLRIECDDDQSGVVLNAIINATAAPIPALPPLDRDAWWKPGQFPAAASWWPFP